MKPKKSFGQNFLTSLPARDIAVKAGHLTEKDTVLEIGPGKGFLTEGLLQSGVKVIAVEKDGDLIAYLCERFAETIHSKQLLLEEGDALTYEPPHTSYKLIANIPYYITGAIISRFLSHERKPSLMVVLVQKEVAERICTRDGKESILSLAVQAYGTPHIVHRVSAGSFFPKPKVDSAILAIKNISSAHFANESHELTYFNLLHKGFAHKRKMLFSNLKEFFPEELLHKLFISLSLDLKVRAENVTLEAWLKLSLALSTPL
jgi:16S rRNA (adenine1518-N6/adenine1519-N6)-dimethyltransferase